MKYMIRILSALLVICLLVAPLGGCASRNKPLIYLKSAIERSFEKSLGGEMAALLTEALSGGSVALSWQGDEALGGITAADATVYFDAAQKKMMSNTALTLGDRSYDARLWLSGESVIVASDAFFGSTTLGADLTTLEADLEHSIFRNNSGTAYAIPEVSEGTADAVLTLVEGFFSLYTAADDLSVLLDKHIESFLKCLTEHARYTRYSEDGKVYIHLTVDNSMLSRALRDTWDSAVSDKKLCRRLRELAKTRDAMQSAAEGIVSTEWTTMVEGWIVNNAEIEALCARLDAAAPFTLELNAAVKKLTGTLLSLSVSYTEGEQSTALSLDLSTKDTLALSVLYGGVTHDFSVHTVKDSLRSYTADLAYTKTCADGTATAWQGNVALDKKQDTYELLLSQSDRTKAIRGTFFCNSDGFSLSVDSLYEGAQKINYSCTLAVTAEAELPTPPQYVNLPAVAEQRIDPVATRARETYAAFHAALNEETITKNTVIACLLKPFYLE